MSKKSFTVDAAVKYGWEITKKRFWFFVALLLIITIITGLAESWFIDISAYLSSGQTFTDFMQTYQPNNSGLVMAISWIVGILVGISVIKTTLLIHDNKAVTKDEIVASWKTFLNYLIVNILLVIIVGIGFVLFIIPGIFFALRLQYAQFLVVDKKMGAIKALEESYTMTRGNTLQLLFLAIVLGIINIIGALIFLIGLFVTVPISLMARAYVYRKLEGNTGGAE